MAFFELHHDYVNISGGNRNRFDCIDRNWNLKIINITIVWHRELFNALNLKQINHKSEHWHCHTNFESGKNSQNFQNQVECVLLIVITLLLGDFKHVVQMWMEKRFSFAFCMSTIDRINHKLLSCTRFGLVCRFIKCTNNEQRRRKTKTKTHYVTIGSYWVSINTFSTE